MDYILSIYYIRELLQWLHYFRIGAAHVSKFLEILHIIASYPHLYHVSVFLQSCFIA